MKAENKKYWVAAGFLFCVFVFLVFVVAFIMYLVDVHLIQKLPR